MSSSWTCIEPFLYPFSVFLSVLPVDQMFPGFWNFIQIIKINGHTDLQSIKVSLFKTKVKKSQELQQVTCAAILKGPNYRLGLIFLGFKESGNLVAKGHKVNDFVLIGRIVSCTLFLTVQVSSHDAFDFHHLHAQLYISMLSKEVFLKLLLERHSMLYCTCIQNQSFPDYPY